jgi:hypothetical protein
MATVVPPAGTGKIRDSVPVGVLDGTQGVEMTNSSKVDRVSP